ncbi:MAG TPA: IS481 family transposase [Solirubrobacteraceae bacterium]|nr:IS481 family transposase [Solirubrobacteraceae bacterium]
MKLHGNAALSLNQRRRMVCRVVEQGWSVTKAAAAAEVSDRTCSKWVTRYRSDGEAGLLDRSSAPGLISHRTPEDRVEVIVALRRLRMTGAEIALCLGMALSTVSAVLGRVGLGKLSRLEPPEPPNRYERRHAGELLHVDVKKLGVITGAGHRITGRRDSQNANRRARRRGAPKGWEFVHVCVDDATRLAYVEVLGDEKATTAVGFLTRAVAFYAAYGITVQRVMTDNGSAYRSTIHAFACRTLGIRHLRTRPYRPRTNGKAERFIRTMLAGWAYGAIYATSAERAAALDGWLWTYNHRRPHGALSHKTPIARLNELNNLPGSYV